MLHAVRILLLMISLLGVVAWGFWEFSPDGVRELDRGLRWMAIRDAEEALRSGKEKQKSGDPEEALRILTEFTDSVEDLQLWDRLDRYYTDCMSIRTELLYETGDTAGAIACARELASFDPRNLRNRVALARLLLVSEDTREEGEAHFAELHGLVPEWQPVADPYISYLVAQERWQDAADVGLQFIQRSRWLIFRNWSVILSGSEKFRADHRVSVNLSPTAEAGIYEVIKRLPAYEGDLRHVRVAPPGYSPARVADWEFAVASGADTRVLDGATWLARQRDQAASEAPAPVLLPPNFVWHLARPLSGEPGITLRFRARVSLEVPAALRSLWQNEQARTEVRARLTADERLEDLELLEGILGD